MGSQKSSRLEATSTQNIVTQNNSELDFIFKRSIFWRPTYIEQSAWLEHIPFAFWLVETLRPGKIVELGTHYGSSYFSFCQAVTKMDYETKCFAVDTWLGDEHTGKYEEDVYEKVSKYNQQYYSSFSTLIRSTFDQALEHFPQGSIDLLHIDGLHTLEAVRHDFDSWLPKLSEKAVVIMHDTNVRDHGFGVFQLMGELKEKYPHFEFAHGHGLGVIGVGSEQSSQMMSLYKITENARATKQAHEIFSRLGKACEDIWENINLKRQLIIKQEELITGHQQLNEQSLLIQDAQARVLDEQNTLVKLMQQLEDIGQTKNQLQRAYESLETRYNSLCITRDGLLQDNANLLEQMKDVSLAQQNLLEQIIEQDNSLALANKRHSELTVTLTKKEKDLANLQQMHITLVDEHNNLHKIFNSTSDELHEKNKMISKFEADKELWQELEQVLNTNLNMHLSEIAKLNEILEEKKLTINKQNAELDANYALIEQTNHQLSTLQQQKLSEEELHSQQVCNLNQSLSERFSEIASLTQLLEEQAHYSAAIDAEKRKILATQADLEQQLNLEKALRQQAQHELIAIKEEKNQEVDSLNVKLSERFNEIAILTRKIEELEEELANIAFEQKQTRETYFAQQHAWKAKKNQLLHEQLDLQQNLALCEQKAIQQQSTFEKRENDLVEHNKALEKNIADRFRELATITRHMEVLNRDLQLKDQQLLQAKERAQNLKKTVSWKLTAPVRAIGRTFKDGTNVTPKAISAAESIAQSGLFNEVWYIQRYPEIADSGLSAIEHFLKYGASKGYSPSESFDTRWYLQTYPDVAQGSINPLLHYIMHGRAEQRHCQPIKDNKQK